MDVTPNAPRSIGGVFEDAVRIYKATGRGAWVLAFILELAAAVPVLAWQLHFMPALADSLQDPLEAAAKLAALPSSPAVWLLTLIAMPIYLIFYNALIANSDWVATGRPAPPGKAIAVGLRTLPRTLLLGVLVTCIVAVGFVLLLVPGIYWAGTLQLAFVAVIIDDTNVSESMAVSRDLIKGHWWRAATLISYVVIIELIAYFAASLITGIAVFLLGADGSAAAAVSQLFSLAIGMLIAPLNAAVYVAMYHDLKRRKASAGPAHDGR